MLESRIPFAAALTLFASATLVAPSPTRACGGFSCVPGNLLPAHDSTIPANAVVLFWKPPVHHNEPGTPTAPVHLYRMQDGVRVELPVLVTQEGNLMRVTPTNLVPAGSELSFEPEARVCAPETERTSFKLTVGPAASGPAKLGTLKLVSNGPGVRWRQVFTGECTAPFNVTVARFAFELSPEAQPFAAGLRHSLVVDGTERGQETPLPMYPAGPPPPNLGSDLGDEIFSTCHNVRTDTSHEFPGMHTVQWLTRLPDGIVMRSNELTVTLTCPPPPPDAGIGDGRIVDAGAGDASARDASLVDAASDAAASVPGAEASAPARGAMTDADASGGRADAVTGLPVPPTGERDDEVDSDRGCALRPASARSNPAGWLVLLAGALLWRTRLRARPKRATRSEDSLRA
jgi:hypothetical protein